VTTMNCEQIQLEELHVERFQVKEVLKILLHSIIFQRALGECRMRDIDSELFDISYVRCDSRLVEQKVEENAEARALLPELILHMCSAGAPLGGPLLVHVDCALQPH